MKKAIAFFLAVCCVIGAMLPIVCVAEETDSSYDTLRDHAVTYTCYYLPDQKKIDIGGTVNHDVLVSHNDFMIEVYRIPVGKELSDALSSSKPLASASIAIKFHFSIAVEQASDRFCRYALLLRAPDGSLSLAAEPQYAGVSSQANVPADRTSFQGISSQDPSFGGSLGVGTAIVPIVLDDLLSSVSNGVTYAVDQTQIYFDKTATDRLDAAVRTYSAGGSRVYLQLLVAEDSAWVSTVKGTVYGLPDGYDEATSNLLGAVTEFLAQRYGNYQSGVLDGIILGKQIDRYDGSLSLSEYAERYVQYLTVVANAARLYRSDLDLVLPFSDKDCYSVKEETQNEISCAALLEAILALLDDRFCFDFPCSTMLESTGTPLDITNESIVEGIDLSASATDRVGVERMEIYSQYLSSLQERYRSAPTHYSYLWTVSDTLLSANAFSCAYAYAYYRLHGVELLSSFAVDCSRSGTDLSEAERMMRYINTKESFSVTAPLLTYFHAADWQSVIPSLDSGSIAVRKEYRGNCDQSNDSFSGSFSYVAFSDGNISDWFVGSSCKSLKADYDEKGIRGLYSTMVQTKDSSFAEVFCLYEYPENFIYTPYLKFVLSLSESADTADGLYRVTITVGNQTDAVRAEYMVSGKEAQELWVDMRSFSADNMAEYIKISTQSLSEKEEDYVLCLSEVTGYSAEYSSEQLAELISAERLRIRNQTDDSDGDDDKGSLVWIIFGVLVGVTGIGAGLFMVFSSKKEDGETETEDRSS